jgi:hypothetical protein
MYNVFQMTRTGRESMVAEEAECTFGTIEDAIRATLADWLDNPGMFLIYCEKLLVASITPTVVGCTIVYNTGLVAPVCYFSRVGDVVCWNRAGRPERASS